MKPMSDSKAARSLWKRAVICSSVGGSTNIPHAPTIVVANTASARRISSSKACARIAQPRYSCWLRNEDGAAGGGARSRSGLHDRGGQRDGQYGGAAGPLAESSGDGGAGAGGSRSTTTRKRRRPHARV